MANTSFAQLIGSVSHADDIIQGNRAPPRDLQVCPLQVREIRRATGLSQRNFARIIHVDFGKLRNWKQGRRYPTGPARALLHVIMSNPKDALRILSEAE